MRTLLSVCVAIGVVSVTSVRGSAQSVDSLPRHAVALAVGATSGRGGDFVERSGLALMVAAERTLIRRGRFDLVGSLAYLMGHRFGSDLSCGVSVDRVCAPVEPDLRALSATVGARYRLSPATFAVRVGPDFYGTSKSASSSSGTGIAWNISGAFMLTRNVGLTYIYDVHEVRYDAQNVRVAAQLFGAHLAW